MNKKKIVVLSSHTPSLFWFRMDMMKEFIKLGYDVFALGNEDENKWTDEFEKYNIRYKRITVDRNGINPLKDIATLRTISKTLTEIKPDKIFCFQAKTIIYGGLATRILGIKDVYPLIAGIGSVFLKDDLKTKIIRQIMKMEYKISMKNCPVIFFQNMDDVEIFKKYKMIKEQQVVMLNGSGVNTERFNVTSLPEEVSFLCIGRLIRDKGIYEYLKAATQIKKKYQNVRCMLVGPYDSNPSAISEDELEPFLKEGIEYFGEQKDVKPYIDKCSVFVLPSYREGTPKTVLEAMSSGRAIITTNAPGCRETVKSGVNGILVGVKKIDELYDAMERFVLHPDIIPNMGMQGRKIAENVFDVNLVNKKICETMNL